MCFLRPSSRSESFLLSKSIQLGKMSQGFLKYYLKCLTPQHCITLRCSQISLLVPAGPKFLVTGHNLLHTSIETRLGGFRKGLKRHTLGWKARDSTNCSLGLCVPTKGLYWLCHWISGCWTWLNGLIVWASLAKTNRWVDGRWTGSANSNGWLWTTNHTVILHTCISLQQNAMQQLRIQEHYVQDIQKSKAKCKQYPHNAVAICR